MLAVVSDSCTVQCFQHLSPAFCIMSLSRRVLGSLQGSAKPKWLSVPGCETDGGRKQDEDCDLDRLREQQEFVERECHLRWQLQVQREREQMLLLEQVLCLLQAAPVPLCLWAFEPALCSSCPLVASVCAVLALQSCPPHSLPSRRRWSSCGYSNEQSRGGQQRQP